MKATSVTTMSKTRNRRRRPHSAEERMIIRHISRSLRISDIDMATCPWSSQEIASTNKESSLRPYRWNVSVRTSLSDVASILFAR